MIHSSDAILACYESRGIPPTSESIDERIERCGNLVEECNYKTLASQHSC